MSTDSAYLYSTESVIFFLVLLFLVFCSGFLKAIKHYFRTTPDFRPPIPIPPAPIAQRDILATRISAPPTSDDFDTSNSTIFMVEEQISPPPYSASILPPPSYDEAIKQHGIATRTTNSIAKF